MPFPYNEMLDISKRLFPKSVIVEMDNYDDVHCGIDIAVAPFEAIRILIPLGSNNTGVKISWHLMGLNDKVIQKYIWRGGIPADQTKTQPDFDFIEKLIIHRQYLASR
jgi:hypothetical protein